MSEHKEKEKEGISRRQFFGWFVGGAVAVAGVAVATPVVGYILNPVFGKKRQQVSIPLVSTSQVPVGTPTFVTYKEDEQDGWISGQVEHAAWVVTTDGKDYAVFDPACTHLGCLYAWNPGQHEFQCPCHGSAFGIDGKVLSGPAPRPLDRMPFKIQNGIITLIKTV